MTERDDEPLLARAREWQAAVPDRIFLLGLAAVGGAAPFSGAQLDLFSSGHVHFGRLLALGVELALVAASLHRFLPRPRAASLGLLLVSNALVWSAAAAAHYGLDPDLFDDVLAVLLPLAAASTLASALAWLCWNAWGPGRRR